MTDLFLGYFFILNIVFACLRWISSLGVLGHYKLVVCQETLSLVLQIWTVWIPFFSQILRRLFIFCYVTAISKLVASYLCVTIEKNSRNLSLMPNDSHSIICHLAKSFIHYGCALATLRLLSNFLILNI